MDARRRVDVYERAAPATGDDWATDDALFPRRPPILSHRAPRRRWRVVRLIAMLLALVIAVFAGRALGALGGPGSRSTQGPSVPRILDPADSQTPVSDGSGGDPAPSAPLVWADGSLPPTPSSGPLPAPTSSPLLQLTASGTDPDAPQPATPPAPAPSPSPTGPPAPAVVAPADGLTVWVVSKASGQHFGVASGSTSNGALIVQSTGTGAAQQWRLVAVSGGCYELTNVASGKALDNPNGSYQDGTQMQQWTIGISNGNQIWCFLSVGGGHYSIRNYASGSLLDLRDGKRGDGVAIQEWSADPALPNANQTWQLIRAG